MGWVYGFDVVYCCDGVDEGLLGGFITIVGGAQVAVHAYAANEGALAFFETDVCEEVGGGDVAGREVGSCCCAVG